MNNKFIEDETPEVGLKSLHVIEKQPVRPFRVGLIPRLNEKKEDDYKPKYDYNIKNIIERFEENKKE